MKPNGSHYIRWTLRWKRACLSTPLLVALIWSTIGPQWAVALGGVAIAMSTASMFFFAYRAGSDVIAVFERKSVAPETEEASKGSIVMSAAGLALTMPMF